MSDANTENPNTVPEQPTQPTAAQPGNTPMMAAQQPQIDVNSIVQMAADKAQAQAEKKSEAVFKSMLQQSGLDTDTINKMAAEWKAQQQTPEETIADLQKKLEEANRAISAKERDIALDKSKQSIRERLKAENLHEDAINLIIQFFPENQVKYENGKVTNEDELVEIIHKSSPGLFGTPETKGVDTANPPVNTTLEKDPFLEGFESKK